MASHSTGGSSDGSNQPTPTTWEEVYRLERARIRQRRNVAFDLKHKNIGDESAHANVIQDDEEVEDLVGLSLSGGGIRSAIYNDGFLQALSHRGLLRYVDYLASVSGGGYIAGHLLSCTAGRADNKRDGEEEPSTVAASGFHCDRQRWEMGLEPESGKVNSRRLPHIGAYLSRTWEFGPRYLSSAIFSFCLFFGLIAVVSTVCALFWRSFDHPKFRFLLQQVLDIRWGGEFAIAFYPVVILLFVTTACCLGGFLVAKFFPRLQGVSWVLEVCSKVGGQLTTIGILVSIAVFLGNGKTEFYANGNQFRLNHYAYLLAAFALISQLVVFFGRKAIFKSEAEDAVQWKKSGQKLITVGVVVSTFFAVVHWMSSENISEFCNSRDPTFIRGEINDWEAMGVVFDHLSVQSDKEFIPTTLTTPTTGGADDPAIRPLGSWDRRARRWLSQTGAPEDYAVPLSPFSVPDAKAWTPLYRVCLIPWIYVTAHTQPDDLNKRLLNGEREFPADGKVVANGAEREKKSKTRRLATKIIPIVRSAKL